MKVSTGFETRKRALCRKTERDSEPTFHCEAMLERVTRLFSLLVVTNLQICSVALVPSCVKCQFEFERPCIDGLKYLQNQNNCFCWISASVTSLQFHHARNYMGCQKGGGEVVLNKLKVLCTPKPLLRI